MAKKTPHAATPALKILEEAGIDHSVSTFDGGREHFGDAVCVLPVTYQLSLKKAAAAFGASKATMAAPADASKSSGYIPGGISPLGHKHILPTVVDETALLFDTIFFSGGKRGLDIEMNPEDLPRVLDLSFADVLAA